MKYLALLFFLSVPSSLLCQTVPDRLNWLALGIGGFGDDTYTGPTDSKGGVSLYFSVNFYKPFPASMQEEKNNLFHGLEFRIMNHFMTINESHILHYYDFDLMYGFSFGRFIRLNLSGGLGFLKYDEEVVIYPKPPYNTVPYSVYEKHYTASFPLEAGISLAPLKGFGLGAGFFANLNGQKPVNGFFIKLEFGRVR